MLSRKYLRFRILSRVKTEAAVFSWILSSRWNKKIANVRTFMQIHMILTTKVITSSVVFNVDRNPNRIEAATLKELIESQLQAPFGFSFEVRAQFGFSFGVFTYV